MPTDLLQLTAELVDVPSESFAEDALVSMIESRLASMSHLAVDRIGDNVVARTDLGRSARVVLAGHTDTVRSVGNQAPRIEGDTLWGLGAADMKGGLAVMLELASAAVDPAVDLTFVFYAREEVAAEHSGLGELQVQRPDLLEGDVAVLGEPTGGDVEAGCQGSVRARVILRGTRAHTARAWMGRNAVHRLGGLLAALEAYEVRRPEILGCTYQEALLAVAVGGGVAGNVVPDEATVEVAHRFAPDRSTADACDHLLGVLAPFMEDGDEVEIIDVADAAMPAVDHPFIAGMIERERLDVRAKLGWTDVARFAALGVPAVNLGPGDPTLAHTAQERVDRASIERSHRALASAIRSGF